MPPVYEAAAGRPPLQHPVHQALPAGVAQPVVAHVLPGQLVVQPAAGAAILGLPPHLRPIRQLGRGAYGTVHLCEDSRTGTKVAVKHVRHAARHGKCMLREVRLLARLRHDNLLHLIDFPPVPSPDFEDIFLVLPYMPSDLHKVIQSRQALTERHVQAFMVQILRALAHLHAAGVAHRDLKPANILVSSDCRLKVGDFGLARGDMPDPDSEEPEEAYGVLTEYVVTRWYRAPEVMLLPKQYTSAVDLWSAGCVLGEILLRQPVFPGRNHVDMVCRVAHILGTPADSELGWLPQDSDARRFLRKVCPQSHGVPFATLFPRASPACLDLLRGLLRWDPSNRLSAEDAQRHEFLASLLPDKQPEQPEPFDWSFDGFHPTVNAVNERLYQESATFHPEILERDRAAAAQHRAKAPVPWAGCPPAKLVTVVAAPLPPGHPALLQPVPLQRLPLAAVPHAAPAQPRASARAA